MVSTTNAPKASLLITWKELQDGLPKGAEGSFLLGVSENKLLLDGTPLETGQAERSFAQLLTTAGLASIHFSNQVTKEEFVQLVRAFALGGSRAQDVIKEIKSTFGDSKTASIRINEVRFVAADPSTGEISIAAQIAAQTLGPEFKQWLNDPQKLLQLIAAAEGAKSGGAPRRGSRGQRSECRPRSGGCCSSYWRRDLGGRRRALAGRRSHPDHPSADSIWRSGRRSRRRHHGLTKRTDHG